MAAPASRPPPPPHRTSSASASSSSSTLLPSPSSPSTPTLIAPPPPAFARPIPPRIFTSGFYHPPSQPNTNGDVFSAPDATSHANATQLHASFKTADVGVEGTERFAVDAMATGAPAPASYLAVSSSSASLSSLAAGMSAASSGSHPSPDHRRPSHRPAREPHPALPLSRSGSAAGSGRLTPMSSRSSIRSQRSWSEFEASSISPLPSPVIGDEEYDRDHLFPATGRSSWESKQSDDEERPSATMPSSRTSAFFNASSSAVRPPLTLASVSSDVSSPASASTSSLNSASLPFFSSPLEGLPTPSGDAHAPWSFRMPSTFSPAASSATRIALAVAAGMMRQPSEPSSPALVVPALSSRHARYASYGDTSKTKLGSDAVEAEADAALAANSPARDLLSSSPSSVMTGKKTRDFFSTDYSPSSPSLPRPPPAVPLSSSPPSRQHSGRRDVSPSRGGGLSSSPSSLRGSALSSPPSSLRSSSLPSLRPSSFDRRWTTASEKLDLPSPVPEENGLPTSGPPSATPTLTADEREEKWPFSFSTTDKAASPVVVAAAASTSSSPPATTTRPVLSVTTTSLSQRPLPAPVPFPTPFAGPSLFQSQAAASVSKTPSGSASGGAPARSSSSSPLTSAASATTVGTVETLGSGTASTGTGISASTSNTLERATSGSSSLAEVDGDAKADRVKRREDGRVKDKKVGTAFAGVDNVRDEPREEDEEREQEGTGSSKGTAGLRRVGAYRIVRALGVGAFSRVVLARLEGEGTSSRNGEDVGTWTVALKMIDRAPCEKHERIKVAWVREVEVLRHLAHPNLTPLLDHFSTPSYHVLALEHVAGGELFDLLETSHDKLCCRPWLVRRMFGELAGVIGWLHHVGVVHRDVKLENILLSHNPFSGDDDPTPATVRSPLIKLTDFGLSRFIDFSSPLLETRCGSEEYAAPELIMGKRYDGRKTDVWALGCVLYALLTRALPFLDDGKGVGREHPAVLGGVSKGSQGGGVVGAGVAEKDPRERKKHLLRIAKAELTWPKASDVAGLEGFAAMRANASAASTSSFTSSSWTNPGRSGSESDTVATVSSPLSPISPNPLFSSSPTNIAAPVTLGLGVGGVGGGSTSSLLPAAASANAAASLLSSAYPLVTSSSKALVSRLLRRDPTKRIDAWDVWDEEWMKEDGGEGAPVDPRSADGKAWLKSEGAMARIGGAVAEVAMMG